MPNALSEIISELLEAVSKDTFNITRNDQDAICNKIEELKHFMQEIYGQHKRI